MNMKMKKNTMMGNKERKYDYGCLMLEFESPYWESATLGINPEDLYIDPNDDTYGLEKECHVTIVYGLHDEVTVDKLKPYLKKLSLYGAHITGKSLFENPNFDVLKFDIACPQANLTNKELVTEMPITQTFKNYSPHMTIAYLKPGMGKKYIEHISEPIPLRPHRFKFSHPLEGDVYMSDNDIINF